MKKLRKPVKQIVIGTYQSMRAAAQQVDLLMKGNGDLCVNIVQEGRKFQVRRSYGNEKTALLRKRFFLRLGNLVGYADYPFFHPLFQYPLFGGNLKRCVYE